MTAALDLPIDLADYESKARQMQSEYEDSRFTFRSLAESAMPWAHVHPRSTATWEQIWKQDDPFSCQNWPFWREVAQRALA